MAARRLFEKLSLGSILDAGRQSLRHGQPLSERVFPLLVNRLTRPGSEHALAQWLEDFYVCSAQGSRWTPAWKQHGRVKVDFDHLKLWYKTLDDLLAEKPRIEKEIYLELRNLFSLKPDLAFYDITSTYFEGAGPAELGRFGYSRDGKPRNPQVVIGVVMMEGWPIAHHVFAGNRLDQTTVREVVQDLNVRFELNRVVFVGDRGMMTIGSATYSKAIWWGCNGAIARIRLHISSRQRHARTGRNARRGSRLRRRRRYPRPGWSKYPAKKRACACS